MQHTELQEIQKRIGFDAPSMAAALMIPYDHYRHMYYGQQRIPEPVIKSARELEQAQIEFMNSLPAKLGNMIDRQFPNGIISEG